ncbi:Sporulation related domain-containing protein [Micromonospora pallida]|uniref:Sporulation related domain-containing protein n=1 Tax=Micromonospora pallida TaxID=145854 RepID=A0A1C6SGA7_9ACTN|nr:phosphodiester glycosidase family protein [Micromonospora pallida]SCL28485.1 Sporulation related domain-containing protein [Micromonospora pallida]
MRRSTVRLGLAGGVTAACLAVSSLAAAAPNGPDGRPLADAPGGSSLAQVPGGLPLGPAALAETRTTRQLAAGVTHVAIERGAPSADDFWTVTVGTATTEAEAVALEQRARAAGYEPRRDPAAGPSPVGPGDRPLGWMVRVGRAADQPAAQAIAADLQAKGVGGSVQFTGEDGHPTTGPWSVDVLVVDPRQFRGRLGSELATQIVPGRETTSSIAQRTGALAAVNGGFFVISPTGTGQPGPGLAGTDGDLAGISVVDGDLVSEAVNDRPALVVPTDSGTGATVRRLATRLSVRAGRVQHEVTGLNRRPGLIVNCGGVGAAYPFTRPAHDYTCGNDNELVAITPVFGPAAPEGEGYQVTLDADGTVVAVRERLGGPVPADGSLLQGTGTGGQWLREHARPGQRLAVHDTVLDAERGTPVPLTAGTSVVNGGPLLLRDGQVALDPVRDGFSPEDIGAADRGSFYNGWYLRRNPRTAAGVTADGRIILLTVDGRRPGHSVGLSLPEVAQVMRSLGAVDALNLDGGGSTAMVVDGVLQGVPSDSTGERPDGDAIVVLPQRRS